MFGPAIRFLPGNLARLSWMVMALCLCAGVCAAAAEGTLTGVVMDAQGAVVSGAEAVVFSPMQVSMGARTTNAEGKFDFGALQAGSYLLVVKAKGFAERRVAVQVPMPSNELMKVSLAVEGVTDRVTVTANRGTVEDALDVSQSVNIIDAEKIGERALAVVTQVAEEEPGIHLQRTAPSMSGIFVRGLTGNKVNVFVDGVRYSTSAQRGGVSTFLNLVEPTSLDTAEVIRGPSSAQYGSDAIGGSIQFLTPTPVLSAGEPYWHGSYGTGFNTADGSFGTNGSVSYSSRRFAFLTNLAGRRINTTRPGDGLDSHASTMRFFNLPLRCWRATGCRTRRLRSTAG